MYNYNSDYSTRKIIQLLHQLQKVGKKMSQVTYVTMVPPNGERDTASPRGRYGERPQRDSCLKIHM